MAFVVLCSCKDEEEPTTDTTITLSVAELEIDVGAKKKITATVSDDTKVSWSSENETVATVNSKGIVSGVSAGETTITATAGDAEATCTVIVKEVVTAPTEEKRTSFSGGVGASSLFVGDSVTIKPTLVVDGVTQTANATITYSSSNANVATVADGVLTALIAGETTITATCVFDGKTYVDESVVIVTAFTGEEFALVDAQGDELSNTLVLTNEKAIAEQVYIKHYTQTGINTYTLAYANQAQKIVSFDVMNGATKVGAFTISVTTNNVSAIDSNGTVAVALDNGVTKNVTLTVNGLTVGEKTFDVSTLAYNAFVKSATTYTDFVEFDQTTDLNNWFSYACASSGGTIELDERITYNGAPSVKITAPTNASYFRFTDILSNYQAYGLTAGSKISFKIRYDGEPKTPGTHYYAIGKLTSKNGATQESTSNICGYAAAQQYIVSGNTEWQEVSYVLDDTSFPLVDLGFKISGNSTSTHRYVYIADIKIDNPESIDYSVNFANLMGWSSTGKNQASDWWGYANGTNNNHVSQNAETATLSDGLKASYQTAFGTTAQTSVLLCPTKVENIDLSQKRCLQNISCEMTNAMKGAIINASVNGTVKVRARIYMEATGSLPATSSVDALIFLRQDGVGYGFAQNKLQTLSANVWTELVFDIPSEYLQANYFTVAFNVKNYENANANINFYIESLAFVSE